MNKTDNQAKAGVEALQFSADKGFFSWFRKDDKEVHPFWIIVQKEVSDHVRSWRFIILIAIIALTCLGSMYTSLSGIGTVVRESDPKGTFFFLKLFTLSDGTLPSFFVFIGFLGPCWE